MATVIRRDQVGKTPVLETLLAQYQVDKEARASKKRENILNRAKAYIDAYGEPGLVRADPEAARMYFQENLGYSEEEFVNFANRVYNDEIPWDPDKKYNYFATFYKPQAQTDTQQATIPQKANVPVERQPEPPLGVTPATNTSSDAAIRLKIQEDKLNREQVPPPPVAKEEQIPQVASQGQQTTQQVVQPSNQQTGSTTGYAPQEEALITMYMNKIRESVKLGGKMGMNPERAANIILSGSDPKYDPNLRKYVYEALSRIKQEDSMVKPQVGPTATNAEGMIQREAPPPRPSSIAEMMKQPVQLTPDDLKNVPGVYFQKLAPTGNQPSQPTTNTQQPNVKDTRAYSPNLYGNVKGGSGPATVNNSSFNVKADVGGKEGTQFEPTWSVNGTEVPATNVDEVKKQLESTGEEVTPESVLSTTVGVLKNLYKQIAELNGEPVNVPEVIETAEKAFNPLPPGSTGRERLEKAQARVQLQKELEAPLASVKKIIPAIEKKAKAEVTEDVASAYVDYVVEMAMYDPERYAMLYPKNAATMAAIKEVNANAKALKQQGDAAIANAKTNAERLKIEQFNANLDKIKTAGALAVNEAALYQAYNTMKYNMLNYELDKRKMDLLEKQAKMEEEAAKNGADPYTLEAMKQNTQYEIALLNLFSSLVGSYDDISKIKDKGTNQFLSSILSNIAEHFKFTEGLWPTRGEVNKSKQTGLATQPEKNKWSSGDVNAINEANAFLNAISGR